MIGGIARCPKTFAEIYSKNLRRKALIRIGPITRAIEGNTLTLQETKVVLEGITVGGKMLREHLEVINHRDAVGFVEEIVRKEKPLSQWQMKNLHRLVLKGIDNYYAGVYRDQQVFIAEATHTPPALYLIQEEIDQLMHWYETEATALHPVTRGAMVHVIFVGIHPFIDGNGRTARLLLNLELMKEGYPAVVIRVENRLSYYETLDKAIAQHDFLDFIQLASKEVERSLD